MTELQIGWSELNLPTIIPYAVRIFTRVLNTLNFFWNTLNKCFGQKYIFILSLLAAAQPKQKQNNNIYVSNYFYIVFNNLLFQLFSYGPSLFSMDLLFNQMIHSKSLLCKLWTDVVQNRLKRSSPKTINSTINQIENTGPPSSQRHRIILTFNSSSP
jgi:hypothetical protein